MTTTNVYQGRALDRNTSRVLAEPGGASSDIFGTRGTSYPQREQPANQAAPPMEQYERAKPSHSIHENNDIFGSGDKNAMHVPEPHHGRRIGLKPKDESSLNVMGGSQVGGDPKVRGDSKTISQEEAKAAVQGQRFKAKGQAQTHNPLNWLANRGYENTQPKCWDDQPTPKKVPGKVSSHNPITWRPAEDSKDYWYGNNKSPMKPMDGQPLDQERINSAARRGQDKKHSASAYNPVSWSLNPGQSDEPSEPLRSPRGHGLGPKASTFNPLTGEDYPGAPPQDQKTGRRTNNQARDTRPW